jgi:hypothetical protein
MTVARSVGLYYCKRRDGLQSHPQGHLCDADETTTRSLGPIAATSVAVAHARAATSLEGIVEIVAYNTCIMKLDEVKRNDRLER